MITTIIFDFGNVMVHFDPQGITEALAEPHISPEEKDLLAKKLFDRAYWDRLDLGTITENECVSALCEQLPARLHPSGEKILTQWYTALPERDGMSALVRDLQEKGYPVYLLSNISNTFAEHWQEIPCLQTFDGVVFSAPLHMVKPTAEIFHHLLEKFHRTAEECLFIDDAPRNIAGAQACGITGYLFDGNVEKLREFLSSNGIL